MLEHGGQLRAAAKEYGIPLTDWLDLSTGINPQGWPIPHDKPIPTDCWMRLPEADDGLVAAARSYYGAAHILPVAGSQAALQALPHLRPSCRFALQQPGYAEHAHAWQRAGHTLVTCHASNADEWCEEVERNNIDVLVLANPNNPDGMRFSAAQLLDLHAHLAARGGWLVIDEAFIDATPQHSLAPQANRPGLIVLRSLGKFFGLAGARVGFVMAHENMLHDLEENLGPWPIAGPSRWIAQLALTEIRWQEEARKKLPAASQRLASLLAEHALPPSGGTALFQWVLTPHAEEIRQRLGKRGILVRCFNNPSGLPGLRFGLPAGEANWLRLDAALKEACT